MATTATRKPATSKNVAPAPVARRRRRESLLVRVGKGALSFVVGSWTLLGTLALIAVSVWASWHGQVRAMEAVRIPHEMAVAIAGTLDLGAALALVTLARLTLATKTGVARSRWATRLEAFSLATALIFLLADGAFQWFPQLKALIILCFTLGSLGHAAPLIMTFLLVKTLTAKTAPEKPQVKAPMIKVAPVASEPVPVANVQVNSLDQLICPADLARFHAGLERLTRANAK